MQPQSLRFNSKRVKRRRVQRDKHVEDDSVFADSDSGEEDERAPIRRRIVDGVKQVSNGVVNQSAADRRDNIIDEGDKNVQASDKGARAEPPRGSVVTPAGVDEPRSQIARLIARRRARGDDGTELNDENAQFRADVERCADVDVNDYDVVAVDKFGARLLAAMGWRPPENHSNDSDDMPVRRPARLGLGAKLDANGEPPPATHSRSSPFASVLGHTASSADSSRLRKNAVKRKDSIAGEELRGNGSNSVHDATKSEENAELS